MLKSGRYFFVQFMPIPRALDPFIWVKLSTKKAPFQELFFKISKTIFQKYQDFPIL
jgi:hypothetical protein